MTLMVYGLCIGVDFYLLTISLIKDIKNDLIAFREIANSKADPVKLKEQMFDIIQFHSTVKR